MEKRQKSNKPSSNPFYDPVDPEGIPEFNLHASLQTTNYGASHTTSTQSSRHAERRNHHQKRRHAHGDREMRDDFSHHHHGVSSSSSSSSTSTTGHNALKRKPSFRRSHNDNVSYSKR